MSAGVAIFYLLNTNAATTASVGGRIFPDVAPQKFIRPAIIINTISVVPTNTLGVGGYSSLDICRVQITVGATTRTSANNISELVRLVLQDVHNVNCNGVLVDWCRYDSGAEFYEDYADHDGLFITTSDYKISIKR